MSDATATDAGGFNWGNGQGQEPAKTEADFADFLVGEYEVHKDAEQIAQEAESRQFQSPPPGKHVFVVKGPYEAPKQVRRTGYYQGREVAWHVTQVGLRFAREGYPAQTMLDFFDLPPTDPTEQIYYNFASKKSDGKNPGMMAEKFGHFIARLGWNVPKGGRIPPEARNGRNWVGRRVLAMVSIRQQKAKEGLDPKTLQPYPAPDPRAEFALFSYEIAPGGPLGQNPTLPGFSSPATGQIGAGPNAPQDLTPQVPVQSQAPINPALAAGFGNL